jgi:hypothetical protein
MVKEGKVRAALVAAVVGIPMASWAVAAPALADPMPGIPGCDRVSTPNGVQITCTQGIPAGTTLSGTPGDDIIVVTNENGVGNAGIIIGFSGNDHIAVQGSEGYADDQHSGPFPANSGSIDGSDGNDVIVLGHHHDGNVPGTDYVAGGNAGTITGGQGDDTVKAGGWGQAASGNDSSGTIDGGPGHDTIEVWSASGTSNSGTNFLGSGNAGRIDGGDGDDVVEAHGGTLAPDGSQVTYSGRGNGGTIATGEGRDSITVEGGGGETQGTEGGHSVAGQGNTGTIDAGPGDDTVKAAGGTQEDYTGSFDVLGNTGTVDGGPETDTCVIEAMELGSTASNPAVNCESSQVSPPVHR